MRKIILALCLFSSVQAHAVTCIFTQNEFEWRNDDGTEVTATAAEPVNTNLTGQGAGTNIRLRIGGSSTTALAAMTTGSIAWYASHNGGTYTVVNTSSSSLGVISTTSTQVADQTATTQQITSGSFTPACVSATGSCTTSNTVTSSNYTEAELIMQFVYGNVSNGDTFTWELKSNCTNYTYTVTPQVTLSISSNANQGWWMASEWLDPTYLERIWYPDVKLNWSTVRL